MREDVSLSDRFSKSVRFRCCRGRRFFLLVLLAGEHQVREDAQDQRTGDGADLDRAEGDRHAADTDNENDGGDEEVAVLVEVHRLEHLQTGSRDKAVKGHADTTHHAVGDGLEEGHQRGDQGEDDAGKGRAPDADGGGVAGDGDRGDGLAVGRVRAAAEEGAGHGTDAVAQQGAGQSGLFEKVNADNGAQVLVVGQVLGEDNEGHRGIGDEQGEQVGAGQSAPVRFHEAEGREGDEVVHVVHGAVVDHDQRVVPGVLSDQGKDGRTEIARENADDEGNQLDHVLAVGGGQHRNGQRDQAADQAHIDGTALYARGHQVADCVACEAQSDDGDRRSDDDRGHQLVDPLDAGDLDDNRDDHIDEAGDQGADNQAGITDCHGGRTAECGEHQSEEREGRAEEHGAGALGEQKIDNGSDTGAEQRRGSRHVGSGYTVDHCGHCDRRRHDGEQLLQGKEDNLAELRPVFDAIDEIHTFSPSLSVCEYLLGCYRNSFRCCLLRRCPSGRRRFRRHIPGAALPRARSSPSEGFSRHNPHGSEVPGARGPPGLQAEWSSAVRS